MDIPEDDAEEDTIKIVVVVVALLAVLLSIVITSVAVGLCCRCYHHQKKRTYLSGLTQTREIIFSSNLHVNNERPNQVVNEPLLDKDKVHYSNCSLVCHNSAETGGQ